MTIDNAGLVAMLLERDPSASPTVQMFGADSIVAGAVERGPVKHAAPFTPDEADAIVTWWLTPITDEDLKCTCGADEDGPIVLEFDGEVRRVLANFLNLVKTWAVPTMSYVKSETSAKFTGDRLVGLKGAVLTMAAQSAWADLEAAVESVTAALPKRATNAEGEPLWLHMPADGAWVATAIAPPEGAEGYQPLYVG